MDNSRAFEEKYSEGYSVRCTEINKANLVLIETELYELTDRELEQFHKLREGAHSYIDKHNISLDYVRDNCTCINNNVEALNY